MNAKQMKSPNTVPNKGAKAKQNSKLATQDWFFTITKDAEFKTFDQLTPNFIASNAGGALSFKLSDSPQFTQLSSVYDQISVHNAQIECSYLSAVSGESVRCFQLVYAYDPDGSVDTAASIYQRRAKKQFFISLSRPSAKFTGVPGSLEASRVQKRLFYDVSSVGERVFNIGNLVLVSDIALDQVSGLKMLVNISLQCKLRGQK